MKIGLVALALAGLAGCGTHDRYADDKCAGPLTWVTYAQLGHADYGDPGDGECLKVYEDGSTRHPDGTPGCIVGRECSKDTVNETYGGAK